MNRCAALLVLIVVVIAAPAAAYDSHFGIGIGTVYPQDVPIDETMGITALIGLPTFDKHVQNQLFADYWRKAEQQEANQPEMSLSDFSFGFLLKYNFLLSKPTFRPYVGAGLGVHMYRAKNIPATGLSEKTTAKAGAHVLGGLAIRVNPGIDLTVEGQYIFSEINQVTGRVGILIRTGTY